MFSSPGFAEEAVRTYLARGLRAADKPEAHDGETDMTTSWIAVDETAAVVLRGEILSDIALSDTLLAAEVLLRGTTLRSVTEPFDTQPVALTRRRTERLGADADLEHIR